MKETISDSIKESIDVKEGLLNSNVPELIEKAVDMILKAYDDGSKILICGNGGSASDSQHFAAELVGRFKKERRALNAISLTCDTSIITAIANDYGYEKVFSRQVEGLANQGDILIGISTSGNSKNIIDAINFAKTRNMKTICLLGGNGGMLKDLCDIAIIVPSKDTARIQESHILIIHIICDTIEKNIITDKNV